MMDIYRCVVMIAMCVSASAFVFSGEALGEAGHAASASQGSPRQQTGITEKLDYYDDGKVMSRSKYTAEGGLIERYYYYYDGRVQKIERCDSAGEKIEESNYDNDGKLDNNIDGWAAKRWLYKDGQLRIESIYGEDGHINERKIYNNLGDLVDRQYVGAGDIDPDEEFNRGSVVTRETDQFYDKYGNQTGSVRTEVDDPEGE